MREIENKISWWKQKRRERDRQILEDRGFLVRGFLGEGAFSRVYWVERGVPDGILSHWRFACKVSDSPGLLEKEAFVMRQLRHDLFPACYELWQEGGCGFLLMEYVAGSSMEEMLERRGRFSVRQVVRMGVELADGLHYLHERRERWLFRDVKPANIMIRQNGRLSLLDFGCVCSAEESELSQAGTPGFAAPEQLGGGERLTERCDVYGLGQTLKAMAGGGKRETSGKECGKKRRRENADAKILEQLFAACTEQDCSRRLPDMDSVLEVLAPLCRKLGGFPEEAEHFSQEKVVCRKDIHF